MVEEASLEDLLVQPGSVEAGLHRQFDVTDRGRVGGGGHQTVRIPALVEYEALEAGASVEEYGLAPDTDGAQTRVALDGVGCFAVRAEEVDRQTVQEGGLRAPLATPALQEGPGAGGSHTGIGARLGATGLARAVDEDGAYAVTGPVGRQGQFEGKGGTGQVRGDVRAAQMGLGDRIGPDCLPDAGRTRVVAVVVDGRGLSAARAWVHRSSPVYQLLRRARL